MYRWFKRIYKNYRNKFIPDYHSLSVVQQNDIDKILLPFRIILSKTVLDNNNTTILNYKNIEKAISNKCQFRFDFYDEDGKTIRKIVKKYQ